MTERISFRDLPKGFVPALRGLGQYLESRPEDRALHTLIKLRVSQMNHCAFCIDMHWREAQQAGHEHRRLVVLQSWRGAELFTSSERAGLRLAEALTELSAEAGDIEGAWLEAKAVFSRDQLANLVMACAETNIWNRVSRACGFALPPG